MVKFDDGHFGGSSNFGTEFRRESFSNHSIEIMCGIIFIKLRPLNTSVKKGKFNQNLCPPFLGFILLCGRIHFVNTITAFRAVALQLARLPCLIKLRNLYIEIGNIFNPKALGFEPRLIRRFGQS